ncbi:MAG: DegT/DnrJ/EryC1/StrS family aminotransferase [Alphaproteobacteria bacterium]|nr:DegT/DnrJ/EryC1/StrS family aminotransferase [Alphaproteobacteria bacterium]
MIPRFSPNYGWDELFNCFFPADPTAVSKFEKKIAERSGHSEAISFRYGRAGLFYLLKALGAKEKKIIIPSYSCVVVAHAIVLSGNQPVFLDNAPGLLQPHPEDYLKAIDSDTIMVIPTHIFGITEEIQDLYIRIKKDFPHVFVLHDCAHSFFCKDSKSQLAVLNGDGALYGMNISKLINTGVGGMLTLQDKALGKKLRNLIKLEREGGKLRKSISMRFYVFLATLSFSRFLYRIVYFLTHKTKFLSKHTDYYNPSTIELPKDFSLPMLPFDAEIGLKSLRKFDARVAERRKIIQFYYKNLENIPNIKLPPSKSGNTWSHFPLFVPPSLRKNLINELEKTCSVEIGTIVDYSVADLPSYQKRGHKGCPLARYAASSIINLPLCLKEGLIPLSDKKTQKYLRKIIDKITLILLKK